MDQISRLKDGLWMTTALVKSARKKNVLIIYEKLKQAPISCCVSKIQAIPKYL